MSGEDDETKGPAYKKTTEVPAFKGATAEQVLMGEMLKGLDMLRQDIRSSNENLRREVHAEVRGIRNENLKAHETIRNENLKAHETTRKHVNMLTAMVKVLWGSVKGSDPPPAPSSHAELAFSLSEPIKDAGVPIDEKVSHHELALASIQGQLIAVDSVTNDTKKATEETRKKVSELHEDHVELKKEMKENREETRVLLSLQKEQMGKPDPDDERTVTQRITDALVKSVTTRDGRKFVLLLIAALIPLVTAIGKVFHP
jgi:hypothetical protein